MTTVTFSPSVGGSGLQVSDQANEVNTLVQGGHRTFFVPALQEVVSVGGFVVNTAVDVAEDAAEAAASEAAAGVSAAQAAASELAAQNSATAANGHKEQAQIAADEAAESLAGTLAAASLSGAKAYATLALANADLASLTLNQVVFIANVGEYYQYNGTSLTFLRAQEFYTSQSPDIASDSVQNMITKLLVVQGLLPQAAPSIDIVF